MSDGQGPSAFYYVMVILMVLSSLIAMKLPLGRALKMAAVWIAIFAGFFVIFAFRSDFAALGQRIKAEAIGSSIVDGKEVRVPMGDDGHFWVEASVNGQHSRFLIDSGASVTTVSRETAQAAKIPEDGHQVVADTANGPAPVIQAYADRLEIGSIQRSDFPVNINARDRTNVLGMNFLSSLSSWRVEGNYLVLRP